MYKVMSDGIIHSQQETRKDAEDQIKSNKANAKDEIQSLMDEIGEIQEYADSLAIYDID